MAFAGERRTTRPSNWALAGGTGNRSNAEAIACPDIRVSAGRPRRARTVGATSKSDAFPRGLPERTPLPQNAYTPSSRCQKPAVAQLREDRVQGRSDPHLNPWSDWTRSV